MNLFEFMTANPWLVFGLGVLVLLAVDLICSAISERKK